MQVDLFYESIEDALTAAVQALGGPKKVGAAMRPDRPVDEAARWVRDCLNGDRREHFTPTQVMWILRQARDAGFHSAMAFVTTECGYSPAIPRSDEQEEHELADTIAAAAITLDRAMKRLEGLRGGSALRPVVGTSVHGGRA